MESIDSQVIYKLAQIETKIGELSVNLTAVATRFEAQIVAERAEADKGMTKLRTEMDKTCSDLTRRVDANEKLLAAISKWKEAWAIRTTWTLGALSLAWLFVGEPIQQKVGSLIH